MSTPVGSVSGNASRVFIVYLLTPTSINKRRIVMWNEIKKWFETRNEPSIYIKDDILYVNDAHVQVMNLKDGDTILITTERILSHDQRETLRANIKKFFDGKSVLILEGDFKVRVVKQ